MPTFADLTRSRIVIANRLLEVVLSYTDVRSPIIVENTFLNHLGSDLEMTGMKAREISLKGVIFDVTDADMQTLEDSLVAQRKEAIDLSIPGYGAFEGFVTSVSVDRNGEREGFDFSLAFKEHTPVERPQVTSVNVAQAVASASEPTTTKTHHVVKGDTYWTLAQRYLNDCRLWRKIADLNPSYEPRRIPIGVVLRIT